MLERKQKNAVRAQLITDLQAAQLPQDQLQYMRRTADLGQQRETMKQKLRRELNEERAGIWGVFITVPKIYGRFFTAFFYVNYLLSWVFFGTGEKNYRSTHQCRQSFTSEPQ